MPVFLYPFGGVIGWLFLAGRRDRANAALGVAVLARQTLWTFAITVACYAPAIATSGLRAGIGYGTGPTSFAEFISSGTLARSLQGVASDLSRGMPRVLVVALVVTFCVGVRRLWRTAGGPLIAPLVIWPVMAILIERVVAPPRVWIYVLPIVFVYSAAGAIAFLEWMCARLPLRGPALAGAAVAVLAVAIGVPAVIHPPVQYTEWNSPAEVYAYSDLDQVVGYLKTSLTPRDAVITHFPLDYPLEYYFRLRDVPVAFFRRPPPHPERSIVLANDRAGEPLADVLRSEGFTKPEQLAAAKLLRAFTYSTLYVIPTVP